MKKLLLFFTLISLLSVSCVEKQKEINKEETITKEEKREIPIIQETSLSIWNENDNVDSPAFWQDESNYWVLGTMKESNGLIIYDARTAEVIKKFGKTGSGEKEFNRPNGIWVIDDMVFVVERDNQRVQALSLPDFNFLGFIAEDKLINPYGLSIFKDGDKYNIFITDNYENEDAKTDLEEIPADSLLDKRVLHYTFEVVDNKINSKFVRYIGENEGEGVIRITETIYADPENNNLLLAEEDERDTHIKVYFLDEGKFTGKTIGKGLFNYQAEGIAMIDCGNGEGYWVATDQYTGDNTFYIFDRKTFEYVAGFRSGATQNTDGVWLTQESYPGFPNGSFFAVNNDGGIGIYDLDYLMNELGINCK